jgi:hypothetical protein
MQMMDDAGIPDNKFSDGEEVLIHATILETFWDGQMQCYRYNVEVYLTEDSCFETYFLEKDIEKLP